MNNNNFLVITMANSISTKYQVLAVGIHLNEKEMVTHAIRRMGGMTTHTTLDDAVERLQNATATYNRYLIENKYVREDQVEKVYTHLINKGVPEKDITIIIDDALPSERISVHAFTHGDDGRILTKPYEFSQLFEMITGTTYHKQPRLETAPQQ